MASLSSTLAWKIPWTEEPGGLHPMGSQRVRHTELAPNSTSPRISLFLFRNSSLQPTSLGDPLQPQRINLITFFATHPSLLYTHPFTFYILDIPLLWTSLFPHVLCIPNSFFGNKVCVCPSSSSLWSLIFRKLWPWWFPPFHQILCSAPTSTLPFPLPDIIITQRFLPAHGGICSPPPQHLIPAPAHLLLLVSVTTTRQVSSSGAQVCSFPLQLGPSLVHTSQLSGYPAVRERGSSGRCRSLWAMTPEPRRGWRCGL